MKDSIYSADDSREVRKVYYDALKKSKKPDTRKTLITKREWMKFKAAGHDMSRYEILQVFLKRERRNGALAAKEKYENNRKR